MGEINGVVLLNTLTKSNPLLKGIIVTGAPDIVSEVSKEYPIIDKNNQTAGKIAVMVKKFAEDMACV
jgi:hypothetical protein